MNEDRCNADGGHCFIEGLGHTKGRCCFCGAIDPDAIRTENDGDQP